MQILSIDPGVKGGAAFLDLPLVQTFSFAGKSEQEIRDRLFAMACDAALVGGKCFMEKVNSLPSDGHVGAFTFGRSYGFYRGIVMCAGLEILNVPPAVWQVRMGCLTGGDKRVSKAMARKLFPLIKVTHNIADALLIAEYGRRILS